MAVAATAILLAPVADAYVIGIDYAPGTVEDGSPILVGQTHAFGVYTSEFGSGSHNVQVYDNGQCIGSTIEATIQQNPRQSYSYIYWQPTTVGSHTIVAKQGITSQSITLTVVAAPAGTTPDPQPTNPSCTTAGGASTGSSSF
ncbi:hypothetical protein ACFXPR_25550 [Nocardia tengchongensis]|uniref:hypothetical protein n=1 Tax=Nocardia tengchongensis TaxID=2055889 RepID=UPI00367489F0